MPGTSPQRAVNLAVIVAALGYFVDIYDLILFSIVRVQSLKDIGVSGADLLDQGVFMINMQMGGMLVGGLLWGILGDRRGRLSVLFGSIIMYSLANIANGLVTTSTQYAVVRFIAGIGLAGELGAGITLVSEVMRKESRGYGTAIVAAVGICGAIAASLIGDHFSWRTAYFIGGGLGLALLALRVGLLESGMFQNIKLAPVRRGDFFMLFRKWSRARRYLAVIAIGIPIWYVIGVLVTFSPEIGAALGMTPAPSASRAVLFSYSGLVIGDLGSGILSQLLRTRKKVVAGFLLLTALFVAVYFLFGAVSLSGFYAICFGLGVATGYWAVFVTIASEQFGTNIRATVTTTAPNFVRGAVVLLTLAFKYGKESLGVSGSAIAVGAVTLVVAMFALTALDETHGKDLNFVETEE